MKAKFERYHVEIKEAPAKVEIPPKFIVKRYNNCVNVQECTQACIYGVHAVDQNGRIAAPLNELCKGCYSCVLKCPKGAISIEINPDFLKLGNTYFTPERIKTIYFEAETGRVPVSGTGYKGPFAGRGFDGVWFDFSEIVRPTRDGIHGREYISTSVDLGRKPSQLRFDQEGNLLSDTPKVLEIPIPMLLDAPANTAKKENLQLAVVKAASRLKTLAFVNPKDSTEKLFPYRANIIPRLTVKKIRKLKDLINLSRIVEIDLQKDDDSVQVYLQEIREINPTVLVSLRFPYEENSGKRALKLTKEGVDIIHLYVDDAIVEQNPDFIKKAIRHVHLSLVEQNVRDEVTFISSGGIAEASHVPKSIILGADAVAIGLAYQIALGCKVCYGDKHSEGCPLKIEGQDVEWAAQRIVNMISSWKDQLLEVLGGMGLREVRRQRGEVGRAMFHEELEAKIFGGKD